jgi:orotate phosphoribosyltransferase
MAIRTGDEWIEEYVRREAYWRHDGKKKRPHVLLTSGLHSNGFFYSKPITEDVELRGEVAHDLVDKFVTWFPDGLRLVQRVVGPATGATKLAEQVAEDIQQRRGFDCAWASPQKVGEGTEKKMVFADPTLGEVKLGELVWRVEDVLTTGGSLEETRKVVLAYGGSLISSVGVIVNRSGFERIEFAPILALVEKSMPMWKVDECPLCAQGSEAIRPKNPPENWARLTADYDE